MNVSNEYCEACKQEHGPLYICPSYDDKRKARIKEAQEKFRYYLVSGECEKEHGPVVASIYKLFAGES